MDVETEINNIRDAIHDDSTTQTWCTSAYTRNHHVYVGFDTREPPDPSTEYPLVHLHPLRMSEGLDETNQSLTLGLTLAIEDANSVTTGKTNAVQYRGITYIALFAKKVIDAMATYCESKDFRIGSISIDFESIEFFPLFLLSMEVTIVDEYTFGDDSFT